MSTPFWALSIAYWLHMLATVSWVGGLVVLALVVLPTAYQNLESESYTQMLNRLQKRLNPLGWFCLVILAATGMFQMSANPNYEGLLAIHNRWAVAILAKHLAFLLVIVISGYLTWILLPEIQRLSVKATRLDDKLEIKGKITTLQKRQARLGWLTLGLGAAILFLTAIARAS